MDGLLTFFIDPKTCKPERVNVSVCFVCCVLDNVCELFGETIRNVSGCSCYFVVECYGCV